jgi:hypothetical protein
MQEIRLVISVDLIIGGFLIKTDSKVIDFYKEPIRKISKTFRCCLEI